MLVKGTEISSFRIVSEESAPGRYAAKELEAYLTRMGLTVGGEFTFTLKIDADGIGNDSYRITVEDDGITICGGNGRGVVYGVYGFLERYAGVRYFTPGLETLGHPDFAVDEDYTYQSVFELRQQSWYNAFHSQDWCVKNGVNRVNSMKFSEEVAEAGTTATISSTPSTS